MTHFVCYACGEAYPEESFDPSVSATGDHCECPGCGHWVSLSECSPWSGSFAEDGSFVSDEEAAELRKQQLADELEAAIKALDDLIAEHEAAGVFDEAQQAKERSEYLRNMHNAQAWSEIADFLGAEAPEEGY